MLYSVQGQQSLQIGHVYRVVWANSKVLTTRPVLKNTACSGHSVATASQALISFQASMATSPSSDRATSLARRGGSHAPPAQAAAHNSSKQRRTDSQGAIPCSGHSVATANGEMAVLLGAPPAPMCASQGAEAPPGDAGMVSQASGACGGTAARAQTATRPGRHNIGVDI